MLLQHIDRYAKTHSDNIALIGEQNSYSWRTLQQTSQLLANWLIESNHQIIAFYADNDPDWVMIDLACQRAKVTLLPLPSFFSDQQLSHAIEQAGVSGIIHKDKDRINSLSTLTSQGSVPFITQDYVLDEINQTSSQLPEQTAKITFTSGSTGQPKGVCLSVEQQLNVAQSLLSATELRSAKHLSLLPFSTLLENIGGIYTALLSGGSVIALPQSSLGFNGSNGFDLSKLLEVISSYQPTSMILLPELLVALLGAIAQGWTAPKSLQFIAVGGSRVSANLLARATELGLPVYEGYGLSECGSVVSVNSPSQKQMGSIGRVLPHVNVSIENDELVVTGNSFLGYVGQPDSWGKTKVYTGDLGFFDEQGYIHINGRKKNLLISSFGRNINPEWLESELVSNGLLHQVVVFGDAQPYCIALIYPRNTHSSDADIQSWIDSVNENLPNYAQIKKWLRLATPLSYANKLMTSNGRPIRDNIRQEFTNEIEQLYLSQGQ